MADIVIFLFVLLILIFAVKLTVFLTRRLSVFRKLRSLRKIQGVTVVFENIPALFSPRITKKPLARITVHGRCYPVYLMNGGGAFRWVHFASEEYAVFFARMRGGRVAKDAVTGNPTGIHTLSVGGHTEFLPKIETGGNLTPILLFSPLPGNLTYVSEKRTSIHVAFTGDEFYGRKVFAIKSFCRFIDRESRENEHGKNLFFDET